MMGRPKEITKAGIMERARTASKWASTFIVCSEVTLIVNLVAVLCNGSLGFEAILPLLFVCGLVGIMGGVFRYYAGVLERIAERFPDELRDDG